LRNLDVDGRQQNGFKRNVIWGCGLDSFGLGRSGFLKKNVTQFRLLHKEEESNRQNEFHIFSKIVRSMNMVIYCFNCPSQWPRGLRRGYAVARFFWDCGFESRRGHICSFIVCGQVEVSATSWSLVQSSPTDCGASLRVTYKPQVWGGHGQRRVASPQEKKKCVQLDTEYTIRGPVW
jgi:hypothetical protein